MQDRKPCRSNEYAPACCTWRWAWPGPARYPGMRHAGPQPGSLPRHDDVDIMIFVLKEIGDPPGSAKLTYE